MGFKLGAIVGFGAGYYLGAKAGRERYEQLNRMMDKAKQTDAYSAASAKARDLAEEAKERAKETAAEGFNRARDKADDAVETAEAELDDDGPDTDMHLPTHGISNN